MTDIDITGRQPTILVVDDDDVFAASLARAFMRRGYATRLANDADAAVAALEPTPPSYAVIDLRLQGCSGLSLVRRLRARAPELRIVMLTGYGSIASTIDAIKLGAHHYLTKPASADEVLAALHTDCVDPDSIHRPVAADVPSVYRVEWEHIHRVLTDNDGNISESARLLGIHRRTLQRKLNKYPARR